MRNVITKSLMTFVLFLSMFLPVQATNHTELTIAQTDEENKLSLSLSGASDIYSLSLNLATEGNVRLMNIQPSEALLAKGARLNYQYNEVNNTFDIYVTSKQNIVENGNINIGTMTFTSVDEMAQDYTVTTNKVKDEVKVVANNRSQTLKEATNLTVNTQMFKTSGNIATPDVPNQVTTITDSTTGISITGQFEAGTVVSATEISDKSEIESIKKMLINVSDKFKAYDITLMLNGQAVQPQGNVTVKMPIPADYDANNIAAYYKGTSNHAELKIKVENGYVVFETSHFSTYVLAEKNINSNGEILPPIMDENGGEGDSIESNTSASTGDSTNVGLLIGLLVIAGLGIGFVVYKNKKDKEESK